MRNQIIQEWSSTNHKARTLRAQMVWKKGRRRRMHTWTSSLTWCQLVIHLQGIPTQKYTNNNSIRCRCWETNKIIRISNLNNKLPMITCRWIIQTWVWMTIFIKSNILQETYHYQMLADKATAGWVEVDSRISNQVELI